MKKFLFLLAILCTQLNLSAQTNGTTYQVSIFMHPAEAGIVTGAGPYAAGGIATVHATANNGYAFVGWMIGGVLITMEPTFTFVVNSDILLQAYFSAAGDNLMVTTEVFPEHAGTTAGQGIYQEGETVHLTAHANEGYMFNNWIINGIIVDSDTSYSFTVTSNTHVSAAFSVIPDTVEVSTSFYPAAGGYTTGQGTYLAGDLVTLTAIANEGYTFGNWIIHGIIVSSDTSYSFIATGDITVYATIAETVLNQYQIVTSASPAESGYVTGGGNFAEGTLVTLQAFANEGYTFSHWEEDGGHLSDDDEYSFHATADRSIAAHFNLVSNIASNDRSAVINVGPNPCYGLLRVEADGNYELGIFKVTGQLVSAMRVTNGMSYHRLEEPGNYLLRFIDGRGKVITQRVVVE